MMLFWRLRDPHRAARIEPRIRRRRGAGVRGRGERRDIDVLGVVPARGNVFHASEERVGQPLRKTVISDAFWRRRFQADPAIVGREIVSNGAPLVISGITPPQIPRHDNYADLWIPMTAHVRGTSSEEVLRGRLNAGFVMGARLKPGVSQEQAQQAVNAFMTRLAAEYPDIYQGIGLVVLPASRVPGDAGTFVFAFLAVLMALVGLVLLVACSNLAGCCRAGSGTVARDRRSTRARRVTRRAGADAGRRDVRALHARRGRRRWLARVLGAAARRSRHRADAGFAEPGRGLAHPAVHHVAHVCHGLVTGLMPALHSTRVNLVTDCGHRRMRRAVSGCVTSFSSRRWRSGWC